jgi:SEC-C motif domain protein
MKNTENCPCGSNISHENCCLPYLNNTENAPSALVLMRSRYTAYCLQNATYLFETTHISQRKFTSKNDILNWAKENSWINLDIIQFTENTVEFKVNYVNKFGKNEIHHEKSAFTKFQNKWFYVDGEFLD